MFQSLSKLTTLQWLYWIICISFILIVFLLDYVLPFGINIGSLYIFPLFAAIFLIENKWAAFYLPLLCSSLILLIFYTQEGIVFSWKVMINKLISILIVSFGSLFIFLFKKSLDKLFLSEEKLRAAIEGAPNGILLVNTRGKIIFSNKQIEEIFGYSNPELIEMCVDDLVPRAIRPLHKGYMDEYLENPVARPMGVGRELFGVRKNGSEVAVEIGLTPIITNAEVYVMSSIIDISERKEQLEQVNKMNMELLNKNRELQRSNQELDDFAYIASHDLKEPLRGIYNNASFLSEDYGNILDDSGVKRLNRLKFLSSRMEKLINDLLYFSRLGRQDLAHQKIKIVDIIEDVKSLLEMTLHEENVEIVLVNEFPELFCDKPRTTEVFLNLITNAIKYNVSKVKKIEIGFIESMIRKDKQIENVIYVRDNGIGIEKEHLDEVFRIFKRLNVEDDTKKGTGVGLTFVRKIVQRHGGQIWVESEFGHGTTFYFYLNQKGG